MHSDTYRYDIDCLRSFAVFIVVLFHCGFTTFSGGFLGVDIFFVISGYVMFQSVSKINMLRLSSFVTFYKKRLFRIYPVLLLSLFLTALFSLLWMDVKTLDYFGKQLFFSSFSLSNILFAQGQNYFDSSTPILLHTWSLAVEMQFYALFPFYILLFQILKKHSSLAGFSFLILSFVIALLYAQMHVTDKGVFYGLENRIFEFMAGMIIAALPISKTSKPSLPVLPLICVGGLVLCTLFFSHELNHPGLYTLLPVGLSAVIIAFYARNTFYKNKLVDALAYMGRISYGIYLFHFPISIFAKDVFDLSAWGILFANILITVPLAHISYRYFETPIRRYGYQTSRPYLCVALILGISITLSGFGYLTAKTQGWPQRLQYFNPYAYEVSKIHTQSKANFQRGFDIKDGDSAKILFIGDSVLQQYIAPITTSLGLEKNQVDSVTRGGCVLLKGVDFKDVFADISCGDLREKLYHIDKKYDYVVISQNWEIYDTSILNAPIENDQYFSSFLSQTLSHFSIHTPRVIVLGVHPSVRFDTPISVDMIMNANKYKHFRNGIKIANTLPVHNKVFFDRMGQELNVEIIHPIDIFCQNGQCALHDNEWSFFYDAKHLTKAGQEHAQKYFNKHLKHGSNAK